MATSEATEVDRFLGRLNHSLKESIEHLRRAILAADPEMSEQIKWNAPSFCYRGQDRITFNLRSRDRIMLVFHRGPKRTENGAIEITDPSELLQWRSGDRATITFDTAEQVQTFEPAVIGIVREWIAATG